MCACNPASHGKDKSCNISQCILAIQDTDPDALYRVATGPCSCGFVWPSCTRPLHLQAVDTLAECLEKTGHYAPAFSTALGLIRLDPASAIVRDAVCCTWSQVIDCIPRVTVELSESFVTWSNITKDQTNTTPGRYPHSSAMPSCLLSNH